MTFDEWASSNFPADFIAEARAEAALNRLLTCMRGGVCCIRRLREGEPPWADAPVTLVTPDRPPADSLSRIVEK